MTVRRLTSRDTEVSLTGHSLGAGLASFAAEKANIRKVYTFNGARAPNYTSAANPNQININVTRDLVGDPNPAGLLNRIAGTGALPGQLFRLTGPQQNPNIIDSIVGHGMDSIVGALSEAAR